MKIKNYPQWVENKIITEGETRIVENFFGLAGEAGEVVEKVKKSLRDNTKIKNEDVEKELGDVVFYAVAISNMYGFGMPLYEEAKGDITIKNAMILDTSMMSATVGKVIEGLPMFISGPKPYEIEELRVLLAQVVLWLIQVARHFDTNMQKIIDTNVDKLDGREERGTISGSGDDR